MRETPEEEPHVKTSGDGSRKNLTVDSGNPSTTRLWLRVFIYPLSKSTLGYLQDWQQFLSRNADESRVWVL